MLYSKHNEIKSPSLSLALEKKLWEVLCKTLQICYQQAVLRSAHTRCDLTLQISPLHTLTLTYWHQWPHILTSQWPMTMAAQWTAQCVKSFILQSMSLLRERGGKAREIFSVLCYSTLGQDLADNNNGRDRSDDDWCPVYTHTPHTC